MKKFSQLILFSVLVLFVMQMVVAAEEPLKAQVKIDSVIDDQGTGVKTVVAGVPFWVNVNLNVQHSELADGVTPANDNVNGYSLFLQTVKDVTVAGQASKYEDVADVVVAAGTRGEWLKDCPVTKNEEYGTEDLKFIVLPCGKVDNYQGSKLWYKYQATTTQKRIIQVKQGDSLTTVNNGNGGNYQLYTVGSFPADPQPTKCGDGVVDTNNKAANTEGLGELCDDENIIEGDGCSKDCKIELEYQCIRTAHGDRKSACNKVGARDLFMKKIDAVVYGKCYPGNYKLGAWNCDKDGKPETTTATNDEKVDVAAKIKLLGKIATALTNLFTSIKQ